MTLSSTDVGQHDDQWVCEQLDPLELIEEGEHLVYEIARTLYWLD